MHALERQKKNTTIVSFERVPLLCMAQCIVDLEEAATSLSIPLNPFGTTFLVIYLI